MALSCHGGFGEPCRSEEGAFNPLARVLAERGDHAQRRRVVVVEGEELDAVVEVARGGGPAVGFSEQDYEALNDIEKEADYLLRLMAADEGYQEGHQAEPEIDADGQNQINNAQ